MALCHSIPHFQSLKSFYSILRSNFFLFFCFILPYFSHAITFNFNSSGSNAEEYFATRGTESTDAYFKKDGLQLTEDSAYKSNDHSIGRAIYKEKLHLWDKATGKLADFDTFLSFTITANNETRPGDGLTFFISSNGYDIPCNSSSAGGYLGLFNKTTALNSSSVDAIVAVEFDNYNNTGWDESRTSGHIGIDVNSIRSSATRDFNWTNKLKANAWIGYNSSSKNLSVYMTYDDNSSSRGPWNLSYHVNLATILPEWVDVGLSAGTGDNFQAHSIHSWSFNSTDIDKKKKKKNRAGWVLGVAIALGVLLCVLSPLSFYLWKSRARKRRKDDLIFDEEDVDDEEFENETGPKRFTYGELATATNNFSEDGKLGEGGFGEVYKGHLSSSNLDVAVKRIKRGSQQGKREYVSEVKIISSIACSSNIQDACCAPCILFPARI